MDGAASRKGGGSAEGPRRPGRPNSRIKDSDGCRSRSMPNSPSPAATVRIPSQAPPAARQNVAPHPRRRPGWPPRSPRSAPGSVRIPRVRGGRTQFGPRPASRAPRIAPPREERQHPALEALLHVANPRPPHLDGPRGQRQLPRLPVPVAVASRRTLDRLPALRPLPAAEESRDLVLQDLLDELLDLPRTIRSSDCQTSPQSFPTRT